MNRCLLAVTSSDGLDIDLHFGGAREFRIVELDVDNGGWRIIATRVRGASASGSAGETAGSCPGPGGPGLDGVENLLAGCAYLVTRKIGVRPYAFLRKRGIASLEASGSVAAAMEKIALYLRRGISKNPHFLGPGRGAEPSRGFPGKTVQNG